MPNCDFYAADQDFARILDFIFAQPGWQLVELASRDDEPLRTFGATREVVSAFDLVREDALLQLFVPESGGAIRSRKITYRPGTVSGANGRTDSQGWGLIQLYLRSPTPSDVGLSHTNHNSEKRARQWESTYAHELGPVEAWSWSEVERASRRLNNHIRRLAIDRDGSRPILPGAAERVKNGAGLAPN